MAVFLYSIILENIEYTGFKLDRTPYFTMLLVDFMV